MQWLAATLEKDIWAKPLQKTRWRVSFRIHLITLYALLSFFMRDLFDITLTISITAAGKRLSTVSIGQDKYCLRSRVWGLPHASESQSVLSDYRNIWLRVDLRRFLQELWKGTVCIVQLNADYVDSSDRNYCDITCRDVSNLNDRASNCLEKYDSCSASDSCGTIYVDDDFSCKKATDERKFKQFTWTLVTNSHYAS